MYNALGDTPSPPNFTLTLHNAILNQLPFYLTYVFLSINFIPAIEFRLQLNLTESKGIKVRINP